MADDHGRIRSFFSLFSFSGPVFIFCFVICLGASQPLEVKVAEDHGRQKAAFYAGYSVGAQEGEMEHIFIHLYSNSSFLA
jgi:hypothetical protein